MHTKPYYRVTENKHAKDEIMKGRGERPLEDNIELILDQRRPSDCPDRGDSIYMRQDRDFSPVGVPYDKDYVHQVEPIGKVDQRDLTWIRVLQLRPPQRRAA